MGALTGTIGLAALALFAWTAVLKAPYPAPWSAPWQVGTAARASAAGNAAIRFGALVAIAALLAWPYSMAIEGIPSQTPIPEPTPPQHQITAAPPGSGFTFSLPDLTWLWIAIASMGLACLVVLALRAIHRRLTPTVGAELQKGPDTSGSWADEGLREVLSESDPRRAILACYAVMERRLSRLGIQRRPGETALEYARRLLTESGAPPKSVGVLTDLFHLAGYSGHPIDEPMRLRAIESLTAISDAAA
jgi:uncharacterized protein DUF4129